MFVALQLMVPTQPPGGELLSARLRLGQIGFGASRPGHSASHWIICRCGNFCEQPEDGKLGQHGVINMLTFGVGENEFPSITPHSPA